MNEDQFQTLIELIKAMIVCENSDHVVDMVNLNQITEKARDTLVSQLPKAEETTEIEQATIDGGF